MQIAVWLLNLIYLFFLPLRTKDKITILSRQANKPSIDVMMISGELESRNINHVVMAKRLNKNVFSGIEYAFHMLRQMYHIATSKVIVVDGYCVLASVVHKKKNQKIIQIWHALGAVKKFGWQSVGKKWGNEVAVARVMKLHNNYDFAIAPCEKTAEFFSEAFAMDKDNVKLLGLPRIDYLLKDDKKKKNKICNSYPDVKTKPIVVYAPTFRKNTSVEMHDLINSFDFNEFSLVIKKHWLDKSDYSWAEDKGAIVDTKYSTMDWIKICDKVITDYSATIFEAAILNKEIYLYFADLDVYKENVGLNMELNKEAVAPYVFEDADKLCSALKAVYDMGKVEKFRCEYISADVDNCTGKLTDYIVSFM